MSFDTLNISSAHEASGLAVAEPARAGAGAPQPPTETVTVDAVPSAPPPEVLEAISAAASAYDRLTDGGVQLHFHLDDHTGKVTTQVYDRYGTVLGTLSPSQVLDVATTGTLD
jgi:hypothetical protein